MARKRRTKTRKQPLEVLVGERVRALREEQLLPRTELAKRSGVALTSLNLLEAGRVQPSLKTLESVAQVLGVRVADLLDEEPLPPQARAAGTKVLGRIMERLRDRDPEFLRHVEKLIRAFEGAVEAVTE